MKKLILTLIIAVIALPMLADNRSDSEMAAIAAQKLFGAQVKGQNGGVSSTVKRVYADAAVAVYSPEDEKGFVIVGRDDRMLPVLGICEGQFDAEKMPCGMKAWLKNINRSLEEVNANPNTLRKAPGKAPLQMEQVAPLITTKWDQEEPYNRMVPIVDDIDGEGNPIHIHAPTGCVATAMAQIMNYHQWPASAKFTGVYLIGAESTQPLYEPINSTYTWPGEIAYSQYYWPEGYQDLYKDYVSVEGVSEEQKDAIATLMRDCGYAVAMRYTPSVSLANLENTATALRDIFKFAETPLQSRYSQFLTAEEWQAILYKELKASYPVLYSAMDDKTGSGHAFIVHGIGPDNLFYINWGWKGAFDGMYALGAFNPEAGYFFNTGSGMVTGIRKEALPTDIKQSFFVTAGYWVGYDPREELALNVELQNCYSFATSTFKGSFSVGVQDMAGGEPSYYEFDKKEVHFSEFVNLSAYVNPTFERGHTYRIFAAAQPEDETVYQPIRVCDVESGMVGPICFILTINQEGISEITGPEIMEEYMFTGVKSLKPTAVANDGITRVYDMQGRLVHSAPTASFNLWDVPARGVLVIRQGNNTRKVVR